MMGLDLPDVGAPNTWTIETTYNDGQGSEIRSYADEAEAFRDYSEPLTEREHEKRLIPSPSHHAKRYHLRKGTPDGTQNS